MMRLPSIAACLLSVVAVIALVAYVGFPQASPTEFMAKDNARRLFEPKAIMQHGEGGVSDAEWAKFKDEINDFPKGEFMDEVGGHQFIDELCLPYNGIDHPNQKGCCPETCGEYCGRDDCWNAPAGHENCCEGSMRKGKKDRFCGVGIDAPCLLDIDVLVHKMHDTKCKQYDGIDDRHDGACCPPECGEFCGSEYCGKSQDDSQCCADKFTATCGLGVKAPCLLATTTTTTPEAKPTISFGHIPKGTTYSIDEAVKISPKTSGSFASYSIKPDLPDDLELDDDTGEITGKFDDDYEDDGQIYVVTAKNDVGMQAAEISFPMKPRAGGVTFPSADSSLVAGEKVKLEPKVKGGAPESCTVKPHLPEGVVLDTVTCVIAGVLKKDQPALHKKYVLTAANIYGEATSEFTLDVEAKLHKPGSCSYFVKAPLIPGKKVMILPTMTGGLASKFTVTPALNKGLKLDEETGAIQGNLGQSAITGVETYTIKAANKAGETSCTVTLSVLTAPVITMPAAVAGGWTLSPGMNIDEDLNGAGGGAGSCTIKPALPKGLFLDKKRCVIAGALPEDQKALEEKYTVTAKNKAGTTHIDFTMIVKAKLQKPVITMPSVFAFEPGEKVNEKLNEEGDKANVCTISPALPVGLELDTTSCVIKGALPEDQKDLHQKYTVSAQNAVGTSTSSFTLDVKAKLLAPAKCTYSSPGMPPTVMGGRVSAIAAFGSGGAPDSFKIDQQLPKGLELDSATGAISGTLSPSQKSIHETYVVTASNAAGHTDCDFELNVKAVPAQNSAGHTKNNEKSDHTTKKSDHTTKESDHTTTPKPQKPGITIRSIVAFEPGEKVNEKLNEEGDKASGCTISPALPDGLELDKKSCVIKGALKEDQKDLHQKFVVSAQNDVGTATSSFYLDVKAKLLAPAKCTYPFPSTPTVPGGQVNAIPKFGSGGPPDSFKIGKDALPEGLVLDGATGAISGIVSPSQESGDKKYVVTASNGAGHTDCDFELNVMAPPERCSYATTHSDAGTHVKITPELAHGPKGLKFTVTPALPKGLKIEKDGTVQGKISVEQEPGDHLFTIVAKNVVGQATCTFVLSVESAKPAAFKYKGGCKSPGQNVHLIPTLTTKGGKVDAYAIQPNVPAGWKFNVTSGEIEGKIRNLAKDEKKKGVEEDYVITAWNGGGKTRAKVVLNIQEQCHAPFPWWIVAVILILICILLYFLWPKPEPVDESYTPLQPEEPEPPPPPPKGLPLSWDTGNGVTKTVIALKKPLGLLFNQKEMPIKITKERDGHGKDIGIEPGWVLTAIGKIDEGESSLVDVTNMNWEECDGLLKSQVGKLPGSILVPLKFDIGGGTEHTVHASEKPLGLVFEKHLPILIKDEKEGSHGQAIGVKVGWKLKAINNIDISAMDDFAEVDKIMHTEINKLPAAAK